MVKILGWLKNKPIYRKILFGFLVVLGLYLLAIIVVISEGVYKNYKEKRAVQKWEEALRKPYKEDIYGGKTPEETWQMFLDALKKSDIELASKYFAVEKQREWKDTLIKIKNENRLNKTIQEFETLHPQQNDKNLLPMPEKAYFYLTIETEEFGTVSSPIVFYLNPITKVWKILAL